MAKTMTRDEATKPKKVLVIDDDADILRLMDHVLTQGYYLPITASCWTEALDAVEDQGPDLLILDLVMPQLDGVALLHYLRENGSPLPVIVVSGHLNAKVAEDLARAGVDAFISKPFQVRDLVKEIERVIGPGSPEWVEGPDAAMLQETPEPPIAPGNDVPPFETKGLSEHQTVLPPGNGPNGNSGPALVDIDTDFDPPLPPETSQGEEDTEQKPTRMRRRRRRRKYRRRKLAYLGAVTLVCLLIAGMIFLARKYAPRMDTEQIKQNVQKSVYDQLLQELKRDQLLDELRTQGKKESAKRQK